MNYVAEDMSIASTERQADITTPTDSQTIADTPSTTFKPTPQSPTTLPVDASNGPASSPTALPTFDGTPTENGTMGISDSNPSGPNSWEIPAIVVTLLLVLSVVTIIAAVLMVVICKQQSPTVCFLTTTLLYRMGSIQSLVTPYISLMHALSPLCKSYILSIKSTKRGSTVHYYAEHFW